MNLKRTKLVHGVLVAAIFAAVTASALMAGCSASSTSTDKWDGSADTSWFDGSKSEYTLRSAEELAGLATLVDSGDTMEGVTIKLGVNVDLDGLDWEPIGGDPSYGGTTFEGNFDGQGNTITGLHILSHLTCQAFFGSVREGTLSNFSLKGDVQGRANAAGVVATAINENFVNIVSDVDVFSTGFYKNVDTAGLCGIYFADDPGSTFEFRDCVNNGGIRANDWEVAGLASGLGLSEGTELKLTNCENHGYVSVNASSKKPADAIAGLVAICDGRGTYTFENCKNVAQVKGSEVAGVAGLVGSIATENTTFKNCSNSGDIETGALNEGSVAAGILAYAGNAGYRVEGCSNTGALTSFNGKTFDIALGR